MSTIKVNNVIPPNAGEGVKIDNLQMPTAGPLSNRNLIINGAMQVAQRGTGWEDIVNAASGKYLLDRFKTFHFEGTAGTSVLETQQSSDVPTGQGFKTSLGLRVKTAGALPNDGYVLIGQMIEGYNINPLEFGTANAKNVTVSFWAKSSVTGTYSVVLRNIDQTRTYVKDYDLVGGTWKHVTLTFPGETSGTWNITNGIGLQVMWAIDTGSNWNTAPDVWNSSNLFGSTNQTNTWADTASNTFHLTGVQVEVGSKSTPFEHRSYGDELARCQRYYYEVCDPNYNSEGIGSGEMWETNAAYISVSFPTTMRALPSFSGFGAGTGPGYIIVYANNTVGYSNDSNSILALQRAGVNGAMIYTSNFVDTSSGVGGSIQTFTQGYAVWMEKRNSSLRINFNAEL